MQEQSDEIKKMYEEGKEYAELKNWWETLERETIEKLKKEHQAKYDRYYELWRKLFRNE